MHMRVRMAAVVLAVGSEVAAADEEARGDTDGLERWECCPLLLGCRGQRPVTLTADLQHSTGTVVFADVAKDTEFGVKGLQRRWDWCLGPGGSYECAFVITADGGGQYTDFGGKDQESPSQFFECSATDLTSRSRSSDDVQPAAIWEELNARVERLEAEVQALRDRSALPASDPPQPIASDVGIRSQGPPAELDAVSRSERSMIEGACRLEKSVGGPASYYSCLEDQIAELRRSQGPPAELDAVSRSERSMIEGACRLEKSVGGPASYYSCLREQIAELKELRITN